MNTVEYGRENREVVVLLHGGGLSWWNYEDAAARLAGQFHVVLPILDGHSGSDRPFTSIEDSAASIIAHIDGHFGGHVFCICGLSLGGQVLAEMLSQRSGICDCAVIESALVKPMRLTGALIRPAYELCYPLIQKKWFARLQFRALHIRAELFDAYYADTSAISKENLIAFLRANSSYRLKDAISGCAAQVTILVGDREQPIMKQSARLLAGRIPESRLRVLPGFRHGEFSINCGDQYAQLIMDLAFRSKNMKSKAL